MLTIWCFSASLFAASDPPGMRTAKSNSPRATVRKELNKIWILAGIFLAQKKQLLMSSQIQILNWGAPLSGLQFIQTTLRLELSTELYNDTRDVLELDLKTRSGTFWRITFAKSKCSTDYSFHHYETSNYCGIIPYERGCLILYTLIHIWQKYNVQQ